MLRSSASPTVVVAASCDAGMPCRHCLSNFRSCAGRFFFKVSAVNGVGGGSGEGVLDSESAAVVVSRCEQP